MRLLTSREVAIELANEKVISEAAARTIASYLQSPRSANLVAFACGRPVADWDGLHDETVAEINHGDTEHLMMVAGLLDWVHVNRPDPVDETVQRLRDRAVDGALVMQQGSASPTVDELLAAGWKWTNGDEESSTEVVAGKRIRYLDAPS